MCDSVPATNALSSSNVSKKEPDDSLLLEEYKSCRDLLKTNIDIMEKSEIFVVGAAAAAAAFCLSSKNETVVLLSSYLPLALSVLGLIRFLGLNSVIGTINNYIEGVEKNHKAINWTTYYRNKRGRMLFLSRWAFWILLVGGSLAFAYFVYRMGPGSLAAQAHAATHSSN
jgi:hypothetical protein